MKRLGLCLLCLGAVAAANDLEPRLRAALVKLTVTHQQYDSTEPWKMRPEGRRTGRGVVIEPGVILTRASNVSHETQIDISVANSARRYPGRLKHVDTRIGLALVEIMDDGLRGQMKPMEVGDAVKLDDEFDIYQLGQDAMVERYTARVASARASQARLTLRLKTTCSDSGNGQIAVKDGKIVGLLTATNRSRQEGTILSVETIRHYLDDFKDGTYHGCPSSGVWIRTLLRDDLRTYYGIGENQHGIAVARVMKNRTGDGTLQEGDVLLNVDGYDLDDEGMFTHEVHGRLHASFLFQGRRFAGDKIWIKALRGGQELKVEVELRSQPVAEMLVPSEPPGGRPQFLVVGGLVILELNGTSTIGRSTGGVILRRYRERANWDQPGERKRIVYVDHVLRDKSNKGFRDLSHVPIESVNGQPVLEIADVANALAKPEGNFHVFRFEGVRSDFVVPAAKLQEINERIAKTYKVTRSRYLQGDPE